jgi:magnesium chelatase family protein
VRPVRGALSIALRARENGIKNLLLPEENATEAAVVSGVDVYPVKDLRQAVELCRDFQSGQTPRVSPLKLNISELKSDENKYRVDFAEVRGQQSTKRALEIASAGGHNILLIGPPGSGKTMLANDCRRFCRRSNLKNRFEITKIHSVAGLTGKTGLITERPFKNPHHTVRKPD